MKRILSITTTGLFLTGIALAPMSVRADQTVVGGKTITPTQSDSTATKPMSSGQTAMDPVKNDDKKASVTPGGSAPAAGSTSTKPAGRNPS